MKAGDWQPLIKRYVMNDLHKNKKKIAENFLRGHDFRLRQLDRTLSSILGEQTLHSSGGRPALICHAIGPRHSDRAGAEWTDRRTYVRTGSRFCVRATVIA